jgi:hypothetical protein
MLRPYDTWGFFVGWDCSSALGDRLQCPHTQTLLYAMVASSEKPKVLTIGQSYSFSKYFELAFAPEDILADLGCTLVRDRLVLPRYKGTIACLDFLAPYLERNLTHVNPISEAARREVMVAPTLLEVCSEVDGQLNIEYPIAVSDWLKGNLDYYIAAAQNLLVVEAKQSDLGKGFTQLAVELIAIDQWTDKLQPSIYGAVTTGEIWKFGRFDRSSRQVFEDRNLYRIPNELTDLLEILIAILKGD